MPTAASALTALAIAVVIGAALTAYLWWVRRRQLEITGGIASLAAMRWREFSHFVVEALQAQGFEVSQVPLMAERGQQADLALTREGQTWLLGCKQGANYRIGAVQIDELANAVQFNGAAGGILATLGRIQPDARRQPRGLELLDGPKLWELIEPLLPPSLHDHNARRARTAIMRMIIAAWLIALAVGVAAAVTLDGGSQTGETTSAAPSAQPARPPAGTPVVPDAPRIIEPESEIEVDPVPLSEDEQREVVATSVSTLPGIDRAVWSTRSTLLVQLLDDDNDRRLADICTILDRYPDLRASRLHLQPPAESARAVRFLQCRLY